MMDDLMLLERVAAAIRDPNLVYPRAFRRSEINAAERVLAILEDDGNPNDRGAQDRAEGQS